MTDQENSTSPSTPPPPSTATGFTIGFLTIVSDPSGVLGGYLVTNAWGRPLEFRMSSAVQPNRVQQILYGPTLTEYLHTDLIGKTLVEKASVPPALIITDSFHAIELHARLNIPTLVVKQPNSEIPSDFIEFAHERSSQPLSTLSRYLQNRAGIDERLNLVDPAVDLAEPFTRIREALAEARKLGASNRAA